MFKDKIYDTLAIIPARGGSKGLPGKNIKELNGKPLIWYTIEAAREIFPDENICVSTDDKSILEVVKKIGLQVPFIRPDFLSTDNVGSWEVVKHAYDHYSKGDYDFEKIALLQPTSPFRTGKHIFEAWQLFENNPTAELVVSVKIAKANPYFTLFEIDESGFLKKSKEGKFKTRQECPEIVEFNGAIYFMGIETLSDMLLGESVNILPYYMSHKDSIDIDTKLDWQLAELVSNG